MNKMNNHALRLKRTGSGPKITSSHILFPPMVDPLDTRFFRVSSESSTTHCPSLPKLQIAESDRSGIRRNSNSTLKSSPYLVLQPISSRLVFLARSFQLIYGSSYGPSNFRICQACRQLSTTLLQSVTSTKGSKEQHIRKEWCIPKE